VPLPPGVLLLDAACFNPGDAVGSDLYEMDS